MRYNVWGYKAFSFLEKFVFQNDRAYGLDRSGMTRVGPGLKMPPKNGMMLVHPDEYQHMVGMALHDSKLAVYLQYSPVVLICDAEQDDVSDLHIPQRLGFVSGLVVSSTTHSWDLEFLSQKLCSRQLSRVWWTIPTGEQVAEFVTREDKKLFPSELIWVPAFYRNHAEECVGCMQIATDVAQVCSLAFFVTTTDEEKSLLDIFVVLVKSKLMFEREFPGSVRSGFDRLN